LSKPKISAFFYEYNLLCVFADCLYSFSNFFDVKTIAFVPLPTSLTSRRFHGCWNDVLYYRDDCFLRRDNILATKTLFSEAETIFFTLRPISPIRRRSPAKRDNLHSTKAKAMQAPPINAALVCMGWRRNNRNGGKANKNRKL
jgi:hypothetical protein